MQGEMQAEKGPIGQASTNHLLDNHKVITKLCTVQNVYDIHCNTEIKVL